VSDDDPCTAPVRIDRPCPYDNSRWQEPVTFVGTEAAGKRLEQLLAAREARAAKGEK
jgi:hypothetical protein